MNFTSNTITIAPIPDNRVKNSIILRGLRLNSLSSLYSDLWKGIFTGDMNGDDWAVKMPCIVDEYSLTSEWNEHSPIYRDVERYIAMVELDVLAAMGIGMSLEQLIDLYIINFPNMADNERNTWYDQEGKIVFTTNKSFVKFGVSRDIWNSNLHQSFVAKDKLGIERQYIAPFVQTNRIDLYREAWHTFESRFANK